jgi:hypothetical protein
MTVMMMMMIIIIIIQSVSFVADLTPQLSLSSTYFLIIHSLVFLSFEGT